MYFNKIVVIFLQKINHTKTQNTRLKDFLCTCVVNLFTTHFYNNVQHETSLVK